MNLPVVLLIGLAIATEDKVRAAKTMELVMEILILKQFWQVFGQVRRDLVC